MKYGFALILSLLGMTTTAQAQPYEHIAPYLVGGSATPLTGTAFRNFVSVGLTAIGEAENASQTRLMPLGPWPVYSRIRREDTGTPVQAFDIPTAFQLDQNYPNPFNPVTTLRFQVPERAHVHLAIYDALGRIIRVLVNEPHAPGTYTMSFDGSGLPSGLYLYRFNTGAYQDTRTMLLLK